MKTKVALVAGGYSKEDVVSFNTAKEIKKNLDNNRYTPYSILINSDKWVYINNNGNEFPVDKNDFSINVDGNKILFDVVLIAIHGTPGEDGKLQGYFDMIGLPYTTCDAFVSSLTFNKVATKRYLARKGVETAEYVFLRKNDPVDTSSIIERLGLPVFVKPNNGGSSFGVTKVKKAKDLQQAIDDAFAEDIEVLIESFIDATEVTCGMMIVGGKEYVFPPTEIVSKNEFFDYEAKYLGAADEITPARISKKQIGVVQERTRQIYKWLNCHGVVRIDYLLVQETPYLIEVNTIPGMSAASIVPQQAEAYGMSLMELFSYILEDSLSK